VLLKEEVQWLKAQVFGRSSEKSSSEVSPEQRMLFNEAEVLAAIESADAAHANRTTSIKSHDRQHTGGRKALPKNFPRKQVPHDIADSEKFCTHCPERTPLERFGEESSERYGYEAPKVWLEQHVRPKYCCPKCHEG
jgi:hypothetical protein